MTELCARIQTVMQAMYAYGAQGGKDNKDRYVAHIFAPLVSRIEQRFGVKLSLDQARQVQVFPSTMQLTSTPAM